MRVFWERLRRRAGRRSSCCRRGRSSIRGTGRCRSRTSRATAASSRSTAAATAARTGPSGAEAYTIREFALDALAVLDATETERAVVVGVSCAALWGACSLPSIRSASPAPRSSARRSRWRRRCRSARCTPSTSRSTPTKGGRSTTSTTGCATTATSSSSSCGSASRSRTRRSRSRTASGGRLETTPETLADHDAGIGLPTGVEFTDSVARVRCPVLVMHGDEDAIRPQAQGVALAERDARRVRHRSRDRATCRRLAIR